MAKAWKLSKGKYAYITPRGKRGIASTLAKAREKAGALKKKITRKTSKKTKTRRTGKKGGGRVAKNKRFSISLGVAGGLVAGLAGPVQALMAGDYEYAMKDIGRRYTGFDADDGSFDIGRLKFGLFPLLVGVGVHMVAAKIGLNRSIGQATKGWPIGITV